MAKKSVIVMGVCGSGKSTIGMALASYLKCRFIDGDDLHPRANVIKMRSSIPLNDEDRAPWLERISDVLFSLDNRSEISVIVCSALKKAYRDKIREGSSNLVFIHLCGSKELILERMASRHGHYMKESMVDSQFQALEMPDATEKDVVNINIDCSIEELIQKCEKAYEEMVNA